MPPQAYDPVQTVTSTSNPMAMDPHSMNAMNHQQTQAQAHQAAAHAHIYPYSAYAPPAYHGHTGYTQTLAYAPAPAGGCPPPPPPGTTAYYPTHATNGQPAAYGMVAAAAAAAVPPPLTAQAVPTTQTAAAAVAPPTASTSYEIIMPHENDVLMGRGGKNNQHIGNERLRDMARSVRDRYKASAKKGKSNMSRELVQKVRELDPPGRFLKRNPVTSEWEDVGDEIAREKVSQVLRDAVSEWTGPKAAAKEAKEKEEAAAGGGSLPGSPKQQQSSKTIATSSSAASSTTKPRAKTAAVNVKRTSSPSSSRANSPARASARSKSRSRSNSPVPPPPPTANATAATPATVSATPVPTTPLPVIDVPATAARVVTETQALPATAPTTQPVATATGTATTAKPEEQSTSNPPVPPTAEATCASLPIPPADNVAMMRSRADTADSEISLDDLPEDLEDTASLAGDDDDSTSQATPSGSSTSDNDTSGRRGAFRRGMMPVSHVPYSSFRKNNKRKTNLLDRYSNMGTSTSDMSITSVASQLSSRNLGQTQLSSRQLMSTGARQMSSRQLSSRQLSSRQLSSRQLSSRQLSSRQLSSRQLSSRQLSSRQLSSRGLMSVQQRKQNFAMMGESDLSLDSLNISGHSKQLSRKNVFMEQYMAMDMGLSDFSLGSLPEGDLAAPQPIGAALNRPSVIIEGDLEELSEHSNMDSTIRPSELLDMYAATGVGNSISNMTMNTIGTFSGHSRMSRGLYGTGNSMRLESGHSFTGGAAANDLQLDMLDDELFDEYDYMDDADEFSSDFC